VAVSKRLRYEVFRRDNHACRYCGATAPDVKLTIDHVVPKALGGSDTDPANLVTACGPCNAGKTSTNPGAPLVDDVAQDALRWSRAIARAAQEMLTDDGTVSEAHQQFASTWDNWSYNGDEDPKLFPKDPGWKQTVDALLAAGLPMALLKECIQITMSRRSIVAENRFRYMCGVAWNKVSKIQDRARQIASDAPESITADLIPDSYDTSRAEMAREVLAELCGTEREQYLEWADDGGYGDAHGEPQTETDRLAGAAVMALSDIRTDFAILEQQVLDTLDSLPGDIGKKAMKIARERLYDRLGTDFPQHRFYIEALRHLLDEVRLPEAEKYLATLTADERQEWLTYAKVIYDRGFISDAGWLVHSAMIAQALTSGGVYTGMCCGTGEHIAWCPSLATYLARIPELKCCGPGGPDNHGGHPVCDHHLEQLMDGTFVSPRGLVLSATDFTELTPEPAPF
jgi:hypothetical protein